MIREKNLIIKWFGKNLLSSLFFIILLSLLIGCVPEDKDEG